MAGANKKIRRINPAQLTTPIIIGHGDSDEVISLAIVIEGLNIDSLKKAIKKLTTYFNLCEGKLLIINYYKCQHILSKSDLSKF